MTNVKGELITCKIKEKCTFNGLKQSCDAQSQFFACDTIRCQQTMED